MRVAIEPGRARTIVRLSAPMVLNMFVQNMIGFVALAMVGPLGGDAIAAVGVGNALFAILLAALFGIDTTVQALVARCVGTDHPERIALHLNAALWVAIGSGLVLAVVCFVLLPHAVPLVLGDPDVVADSVRYLELIAPMLLFAGISYACGAFWNGSGRPWRPLGVATLQLICSIVFNAGLVYGAFGFTSYGPAGAGLSAGLAGLIALCVHLLLLHRRVDLRAVVRATAGVRDLRAFLSIGLPVSLQQSLWYVGASVLLLIVGMLGTREVAATNIMAVIMLVSVLSAIGLGIAAATLVGQSIGRGALDEATRWGWEVARLAAGTMLVLSILVISNAETVLRLFTSDSATIALASVPLQITAAGMSVDAFCRVIGFSLRGAGSTRVVTGIAFGLQWLAQLPLCWYFGVHLGHGLLGIAIIRLLLVVVECTLVSAVWRTRRWLANTDATGRAESLRYETT